MEIKGKIFIIGETETVGQKDFKKRLVVIETDEQYSQKIPIDFVQDKTNLLDAFQNGQSVTVGVNVRGSEYNGKYYVNFQGWSIK